MDLTILIKIRGCMKKVGIWIATAMIVGNMIGSGIFLLPANLAQYGGISIFGWIISTIGAMSLAYVFSELSKTIRRGGGPYAFTFSGFGDFAGFWIAWGYWISCWSAVASISIALTGALSVFFPILNESTFVGSSFAISMILIITLINLQDIRKVGQFQTITTLLKLIPIFLIALFGFADFNSDHMTPFNQSDTNALSAIVATITLTLWAFLGFESATIITHKVRNPEITVPKATLFGTLFVAIIYISSSFSIMGIIPPETLQVSAAPFADAASVIWGNAAGKFIAIGVAISCLGAMNGWTVIQGQIPHAASEDRLFPRYFSTLNRNEVPSKGIIISSTLAAILIGSTGHLGIVKQFEIIILISTLTAVIPYSFCSMTYFKQFLSNQSSYSQTERIKRIIIISIAFAFSLVAIYGSGKETVFSGFILLICGLPVYIWMKNNQLKEKKS
jgi:APA family basic amino acid/polyamine antiporter